MKGNVRYVGFAFLGALLALTSCRDLALQPVFYTLSKEQPLGDDRGFPDTASVFKMARVTITTPAGDYYLAAAGKLYIRGTGPTDTWTVVDPPAGRANAMCNSMEVLGTQIYAGFFNGGPSLEGYGLYSASLAALPLVWAPVAAFQNIQITLLKNVAGQLFVATHTGSVNALYYGDGATFTPMSWATAPAADLSFIDVAQASADSSYWILVGGYLYQSAGLPGPFSLYAGGAGSPPVSPLSSLPASGGLFDDGTLYVAGGNGHLYSTDDGGANWVKSAQMLDDKKDPIHFTSSFVLPASDDNIPANTIYVGTQGQGYRRVPGGDVTGGAGTLTREPTSYSITALYNGAINFLFYDDNTGPDPHRLFVCTSRSGLWRGEFAGGSTWTWKQE